MLFLLLIILNKLFLFSEAKPGNDTNLISLINKYDEVSLIKD